MNLVRTVANTLTKVNHVNHIQIRHTTSFFVRLSASSLWKSVTSVSSVGRKRGRMKGLRKKINLNKGQVVGQGRKTVNLPGLNAKAFEGRKLNQIKVGQENKEYDQMLLSKRGEVKVKKRQKLHPMERGYSSTVLFGRSIGIPDQFKEDYADFDCKMIRQVVGPKMVSRIGRVRNVLSIAVVGNRKGLVGYGQARDKEFRKSANMARTRALKKLRYIQMDGGSIIHDFTSTFGGTTICVFKMPPGFGLAGDRTINSICRVIGISDLYSTVIRCAHNQLHVLRAFILGLTQQKTYQQIADEKGLNLVEFKEETDYLPKIIARPAPENRRDSSDIDPLEIMDLRQYIFDGKVYDTSNLDKPSHWVFTLNYARFLKEYHRKRSRLAVRATLRRRHDGKVESFLTLREKEKRLKKFGRLPEPQKVEYKKDY